MGMGDRPDTAQTRLHRACGATTYEHSPARLIHRGGGFLDLGWEQPNAVTTRCCVIPTRVVVGVVCVFVGLLVLVVVIGLIRNQIDANGLAIALVPAITGVIVGGAIRLGRGDSDPPDDKP